MYAKNDGYENIYICKLKIFVYLKGCLDGMICRPDKIIHHFVMYDFSV